MVPQFMGDPVNLPTFSQMLSTVMKVVGPIIKNFLLGSFANKLKGRAADQFLARLMRFRNVKKFLTKLQESLRSLINEKTLMHTLKRLRQEQNESVEKYATTMQSSHNKILLAYDTDTELSKREFYRKEIRLEKETIKQFLNKLLPHLYNKVTSLRSRNLADAILCAKRIKNGYASKDYSSEL